MPPLFQDFDPAAFWAQLGSQALIGGICMGVLYWLLSSTKLKGP